MTSSDGRVVAESVTTSMVGSVALDDTELRSRPVVMDVTVAVFRSPLRSTYHTLIDDLPRAGLLMHPALTRLGPVTLLHDGPLSRLETGLLAHLGTRRVSLMEVEPGRPIRAERVVLPGFVTRSGAGAVPSWYRRWSDGVPLPSVPDAPRRILLDSPGVDVAHSNGPAILEVLAGHGIERIDVTSVDPLELLGMLRGAELVVGRSGQELSNCLFSRSAHVVELLDDVTLDPAIYYLAASKGLPYDYVPARPGAAVGPELDVDWLDRLLDRIG